MSNSQVNNDDGLINEARGSCGPTKVVNLTMHGFVFGLLARTSLWRIVSYYRLGRIIISLIFVVVDYLVGVWSAYFFNCGDSCCVLTIS